MFCALHDQLASLGRHAQLTRCFSAVAELLVNSCGGVVLDMSYKQRRQPAPASAASKTKMIDDCDEWFHSVCSIRSLVYLIELQQLQVSYPANTGTCTSGSRFSSSSEQSLKIAPQGWSRHKTRTIAWISRLTPGLRLSKVIAVRLCK